MMDFFSWGYPGLFLASFLAATVVPFSSEFILTAMIYAGYDPLKCLVLATLGNWGGGLTSWYLGYLGKMEWITRFLRVDQARIQKTKVLVDRYGSFLAFFSWTPFVGDALAVGLGLFRVSFPKTAAWMLLGKCLRYAAVAWLSGLIA